MQALDYRTNRDLFSDQYLDEHLPETDAWNIADEAEVRNAFERLTALYREQADLVAEYDERQFRANLLDPVFEVLGLNIATTEQIRDGRLRSEYALFGNERPHEDGNGRANALAVAEIQQWGKPLDNPTEQGFANPSCQMYRSLDVTELDYGILTNGTQWRLYHDLTSHRLDSYYEIDLPTLLETGTVEDFKYFYLFFGREAFLGTTDESDTLPASHLASDRPFVERVHRRSNRFTEKLSEDLRENVYEALTVLAEGFVTGGDDLGQSDLDQVYEACLTYLYRLIFVLYAESNGQDLLDTDTELYRKRYSLDTLKRRVVEELDSSEPIYRERQTTLWKQLDELFTLIDSGREPDTPADSPSVPSDDPSVPADDGGLFETNPEATETAAFLDSHAVGDSYLARVIELLTVRKPKHDDNSSPGSDEGRVFVDYSSLDVRHLGSIYEGLLEYDLEIADEPLVATCENGEQQWIREQDKEDGKPADFVERVEEGDVYLTTETGKRKATGSYYTPEFVVKYVVERTLDPLLDEIRADLDVTDSDYAETFAERVFELSVLDPAMGSGHFLVKTVEYLARSVVEAQQKQAQQATQTATADLSDVANPSAMADPPDITNPSDVHWARGQVAKHCIYGVDENGMAVELAKVSLWLRTLAAEQPLALLDHHLKQGDSLAGADVEAVGEVGRDDLRQRLTAMANVHTAERFGLDVPSGAYERMGRSLDDERAWQAVRDTSWFKTAQRVADDHDFFHWKLAFPGVFYESDGTPKSEMDAGFDAVVGNPPYVRSRNLPEDVKEYYRQEFWTAKGAYDLYVPFVELSTDLGRRVSLVVPNKWTTTEYGRNLRDLLLADNRLREVLDASNLDVFSDVDIYPVVLTCESDKFGTDSDEFAGDEIQVRNPTEEGELASAPTTTVSRSFVDRLGGRVVPLDLDAPVAEIASRVLADCDRFGDHATMTEGVHTGNVREKLLTEDPNASENDACKKLVGGDSVGRYLLDWDGTWLRYDESLVDGEHEEYADFRDADCFEGEKLLVRDISDRPVAVYDDEGYYALNTLYSVRARENSDLSLRYLLGVFNSEFVATYFRQVYGGTHVSGDYLRFKPMFSTEIPIPDPDPEAVSTSKVVKQAGAEPVSGGPETAIATLTERLREARDERAALNFDALDYLPSLSVGRSTAGSPSGAGPTVAEISTRVEGVDDSILAETTSDREGLRIGSVRVEREGDSCDGRLLLSATARYKPDDAEGTGNRGTANGAERKSAYETDQWGYVETDPVPAMAFSDLGETEAALVEAFVPAAVERSEGFARFRANATKTNSLLDRLQGLTLPDPENVTREVAQYQKVREQAEELDGQISALEDAIDGIVYRLYGLDEAEIAVFEKLSE